MSLTWTQLAELAAAAVGCNVAYAIGRWGYWLTASVRTLVRDSRRDPLTGLGTGHWLESERWFAALRSGRALGVVYLDLDHLKRRNDQEGHEAGDLYIQSAADALGKSCRRGVDEVFRMYTAGDEALIAARGSSRITAQHIERVLCPVEPPADLPIPIGTSLKEAERLVIRATLAAHGGHRAAAAAALGISRRTLYEKLVRFRAPNERPDSHTPSQQ